MDSDRCPCHKLRKTDWHLLNVLESNRLCTPSEALEAYAWSAPPYTGFPVDKCSLGLDSLNSEKTQELLLQLPPVKELDKLEYHMSKPSKTLAEEVEVQLSETCGKRFVVFDQSGGLNRIIFHPAVMTNFSESPPVSVDKMMDFFSCLHDTSLRAVSKLKDRMNSLPFFEFAMCNAGSMESPLVRHSEITVTREPINNMHDSDYDHEKTEDIDALLSSDSDYEDDEVNSTEQCFGDLTWKDSPREGVCSNVDCKKRKWKDVGLCLDEEDDADSAAVTILGAEPAKVISSTLQAGIIKQSPLDDADSAAVTILGTQPAKAISSTVHTGIIKQRALDIVHSRYERELCSYGLRWPDELSSSNACNNNEGQLANAAKEARKERIRSSFRLLRDILPDGGEGRGTTNVLDEAIEFVKGLEVTVKKLEAKRYIG